jgi:Tol biopolymer transport system component
VVYRADSEADQVFQVYSRALDGSGSPVELNGSLVSGGHVTDFRISPDSSRVVYHADQDTDNVYELYSVPLDGSDSPVKLNGSPVGGGDVTAPFHISPDGRRVVYRADQDTDGVDELYGVSLDGSSSPIKLNGDLTGGGNVYFDFQISPDSEVVVYRADQDLDEVIELYASTGFGSYTIFLPVILREL